MFSKNNQEEMGKSLPQSWIDEVHSTLTDVYKNHCITYKKKLEVYGFSYSNELVLIISILDIEDRNKIPVTYTSSVEITAKNQPLQLLHSLVDASGIFLDAYFFAPNWDDYCSHWQETTYQTLKFFYKITRENITLSIQASKLLVQEN